jgi:hypothetical protein
LECWALTYVPGTMGGCPFSGEEIQAFLEAFNALEST